MRMSWAFGRNNALSGPLAVALLVLACALLLRAFDPAALGRLRDFGFDSFQRLQPRQYSPETPVRIIDIDEASLADFAQCAFVRRLLPCLVHVRCLEDR